MTAGSVVYAGPEGTRRQRDRRRIANGYNDTYAAYYLSASGNQVAFTFTPARRSTRDRLRSSSFRTTQPRSCRRSPSAGVPLTVNDGTANSGAFVSLDAATRELWVTLNQTVSAPDPRADRALRFRRRPAHSGSMSPEPPKSFGKSLNFGRPSRTASTFSP